MDGYNKTMAPSNDLQLLVLRTPFPSSIVQSLLSCNSTIGNILPLVVPTSYHSLSPGKIAGVAIGSLVDSGTLVIDICCVYKFYYCFNIWRRVKCVMKRRYQIDPLTNLISTRWNWSRFGVSSHESHLSHTLTEVYCNISY